MSGNELWRLTALPLTPIHVGDGTSLSPEEWRINDGAIERFSAARVLAAMGAGTRRRYLAELDQGRLQEAQAVLREAVEPEHVVERVEAGGESLRELRQAVDNPLRRGDIRPFARTGGRPFVPGSSIKGAFRTALLSRHAEELEQQQASELWSLRNSAERSDRLEELALARPRGRTEQDPLRFLSVADAALPGGATRIDRIENWKPRGRNAERAGMQMHYERLRSSADGRGARLTVGVRVDAGRLAAARAIGQSERLPALDLVPRDLWDITNAFHWKRWDAERRMFEDEPATLDVLGRITRLRVNGRVVGEEELRRGFPYMLLRVGRFTQFESKSVDVFREGWNARARRPMEEGTTRNIVRLPAGRDGAEAPVPLGWLLLVQLGGAR